MVKSSAGRIDLARVRRESLVQALLLVHVVEITADYLAPDGFQLVVTMCVGRRFDIVYTWRHKHVSDSTCRDSERWELRECSHFSGFVYLWQELVVPREITPGFSNGKISPGHLITQFSCSSET